MGFIDHHHALGLRFGPERFSLIHGRLRLCVGRLDDLGYLNPVNDAPWPQWPSHGLIRPFPVPTIRPLSRITLP